jgi:hypothetical protein
MANAEERVAGAEEREAGAQERAANAQEQQANYAGQGLRAKLDGLKGHFAGDGLGYFTLFFIIHMAHGMMGFARAPGLILYSLFLVIMVVSYFWKERDIKGAAIFAVLCVLGADQKNILQFFQGLIGSGFFSTEMLGYLVLLFPIVGLYIYNKFDVSSKKNDSMFIRWMVRFYYIIIIIFFIMVGLKWVSHIAALLGWIDEGEELDLLEIVTNLLNTLWEWIKEIWRTLLGMPGKVNQQKDVLLEKATGGYYEGKVEKNQKEPIGVYITEFKPADSVYYKDEIPTLWATVTGKSFEEVINLQLACYGKGKKLQGSYSSSHNVIPGNVQPQTVDSLFASDVKYYDCVFNPGELPEGNVQTAFAVGFDFKTMSYIKSYFMDEETRQTFIRQGSDPLKVYDIKEKTPVAIYTNGPVKIGMGVQPLIGVKKDEEETKSSIGVSMDNRWDGELFEIKELTLLLPEHVTIEADQLTTCNKKFKAVDAGWCQNQCELEKEENLKHCNGVLTELGYLNPKGRTITLYNDEENVVNILRNLKVPSPEEAVSKLYNEHKNMLMNDFMSETDQTKVKSEYQKLQEFGLMDVITLDFLDNSNQGHYIQELALVAALRANAINFVEVEEPYRPAAEYLTVEEYVAGGLQEYACEEKAAESLGLCKQDCEDFYDGYNAYTLDIEELNKHRSKLKDSSSFQSFKCTIDIDRSLLGNVPITTKYFRALSKYKYQIQKESGVRLKYKDGYKPSLNDCVAVCDDEDGCLCPNNCKKTTYVNIGKDCGLKPSGHISGGTLMYSYDWPISTESPNQYKIKQCYTHEPQPASIQDPARNMIIYPSNGITKVSAISDGNVIDECSDASCTTKYIVIEEQDKRFTYTFYGLSEVYAKKEAQITKGTTIGMTDSISPLLFSVKTPQGNFVNPLCIYKSSVHQQLSSQSVDCNNKYGGTKKFGKFYETHADKECEGLSIKYITKETVKKVKDHAEACVGAGFGTVECKSFVQPLIGVQTTGQVEAINLVTQCVQLKFETTQCFEVANSLATQEHESQIIGTFANCQQYLTYVGETGQLANYNCWNTCCNSENPSVDPTKATSCNSDFNAHIQKYDEAAGVKGCLK